MILFIIFLLFSPTNPEVEREIKAHNYIETYKEIAIIEMYRTGIPASITMAQALHESNLGHSDLALNAKNHFGIKCKSYWIGHTYYHKDDDRNKAGKLIDSCFRSYESVIDSYVDHSNFLKMGQNYRGLFSLAKDDYKAWAYGLKRAGYATDKLYAEKLIKYVEKYSLASLDSAPNPFKSLKK